MFQALILPDGSSIVLPFPRTQIGRAVMNVMMRVLQTMTSVVKALKPPNTCHTRTNVLSRATSVDEVQETAPPQHVPPTDLQLVTPPLSSSSI